MSQPEHISSIIERVMPIRIVIPGAPASYQKKTGMWHTKDWSRAGTNSYDTKGYKVWRDYARGRAAEVAGNIPVSDEAVSVVIKAYFLAPKSKPQKFIRAAYEGLICPLVKDVDNICKAIFDSCLTGIVIRDDKQVGQLSFEKWFDPNPRVEIEVWPWKPRDSGGLFTSTKL